MKGDIFHVLNRGVDKRKVFLNEKDYIRFIYNLYDFNDLNNVVESYYRRREKFLSDVRRPTRNKIVDILCWSLLPNHIHILVQEKVDGGASLFSKKIIGGYTKYFNEDNERSGVLFQGRSKIIRVERNEYFLYLPFYVLANPLDLIESSWREKCVKDIKKAVRFLENYKYSSFPNLIGRGNFPFTANKDVFYKLFDTNEKQFRKDFIEWLSNVGRATSDKRLLLDKL